MLGGDDVCIPYFPACVKCEVGEKGPSHPAPWSTCHPDAAPPLQDAAEHPGPASGGRSLRVAMHAWALVVVAFALGRLSIIRRGSVLPATFTLQGDGE